MNQRDAKRIAHEIAASVLESAIDTDILEPYPEADALKIEDALKELAGSHARCSPDLLARLR